MATIAAGQSRIVFWANADLTLAGSIFDVAGHTIYALSESNGASLSWKHARSINSLPNGKIKYLSVYRIVAGSAAIDLGSRVSGAGGTVDLSYISNAPLAVINVSPSSATGTTATSFGFTATGSTAGNGTVIQTYEWSFGDGSTSSAMAPTHTYTAAGSYTVSLRIANNLGVFSAVVSKVLTVSVVGGGPSPGPSPSSGGGFRLGMNLSTMVDWDGSVTVDRMHNARDFQTNTGTLTKDANGYVTALTSGQTANAPIVIENAKDLLPTGTWVFLWEGDRQNSNVSLRGQALTYSTAIGATSHRATFTWNGTSDIWLDITQVATNYPKNFNLILPGYENNQTAFAPPFLKRMTFKYARFMDWQNTNWDGAAGNRTSEWNQRSTLNSYSQTGPTGASLELIFRLCNQQLINPYLNIPVNASNDYITQFLTYIKNNLDPSLTAYVEFSNEAWSGQFGGFSVQATKGQAAGLQPATGTNQHDYAWAYQAYITANISKMADSIFGNQRNRVKVCISGQAGFGNAYQASVILNFVHPTYAVKCGTLIDRLVIAPYFNSSFNDPANYQANKNKTNTQLYDDMKTQIDTEVTTWINNHKTVAADFPNLEICLYEGGQHFTLSQAGNGLPSADQTYVGNKIVELNNGGGMYDVYLYYLNKLKTLLPNAIFWHFNCSQRDSPFGCWGSQKSYITPLSQSPKRRALHQFNGDSVTDLEIASW